MFPDNNIKEDRNNFSPTKRLSNSFFNPIPSSMPFLTQTKNKIISKRLQNSFYVQNQSTSTNLGYQILNRRRNNSMTDDLNAIQYKR